MSIKAVPLTLKEAQAFVDKYHRHHKATCGDKFRVGAEIDGEMVGIVQVGRPLSRILDNGMTVEVLRLCVNGDHKNVCSFLYSKAARVAKELGYKKIITYILESELGTSLIASGWHLDAKSCGGASGQSLRDRENCKRHSYRSLTINQNTRQRRNRDTQKNCNEGEKEC